MSIYYFAYGSNMLSERMRSRIPDAEIVGIAFLSGWKFVWDKISKDNSAKANLMAEEGTMVWGVVYRLPEEEIPHLDSIEGGDQRIEVSVQFPNDTSGAAITYVSENRDASLLPYDWYKKIVLKGAQEHLLPPIFIDEIAHVASKHDDRNLAGEIP